MRSFSVQTTIALLIAIAATAVAIDSRKTSRNSSHRENRHLLLDNVDVLNTEPGGLLAKVWGEKNTRDGVIVNSIKTSQEDGPLSAALDSASLQRTRMRGGVIHQGSGALQGQVGGKGIGKGYHYGKDCKGAKGSKGKGKGKGDGKATKGGKAYFGKGKGDGKGSHNPTRSPTMPPSVSTAPSYSPSESPTDSPTEEWCHEDFWPSQQVPPNHHLPTPVPEPTVSPAPSGSMEPSETPTRSPAPTATPAPTDSEAPSDRPSESHAPNFIVPPSALIGTSPGQQSKSFCQLFDAQYIDNGNYIAIWNPDNNRPEFEKDATAAVKSAIGSPIDASGTRAFRASLEFNVTNDETSNEVIAGKLDEVITSPTIYQIIDCQNEAMAFAENYYNDNKNQERKLQFSDRSTFISMRNWNCPDKTCNGDLCKVSCNTGLNYIGSLNFGEFEDVLYWSLKEYLSMMDDVTAWYPRQVLFNDNIAIEEVNDPVFTGINESGSRQSTRNGMRAGPFIGAATGLMALLLLMVLFVRRRRYQEDEVSHLKLDDDGIEDDTFYNGSDGDSVQNRYNTRDTHIVGEGDSVISHWTGYTGRRPTEGNYEMSYNRSGLMKGSPADVHQCSSATCDICHENRQKGVQFVKTGILLPERSPSLPSENSRGYIQDDTVLL